MPTSIWSAESKGQDKSTLINKAQKAYYTFSEDKSCLFSRKKQCTREQKKRIAIAATAVIGAVALLVATGIGIGVIRKRRGFVTTVPVSEESVIDVSAESDRSPVSGELARAPVGAAPQALGTPSSASERARTGALAEKGYESGPSLKPALLRHDIERVRELLARGVNVNQNVGFGYEWEPLHGSAPLHIAAQQGDLAIVELLVQQGADINARDDRAGGLTPLHWAVDRGHAAVVEFILQNGADVNARDNFGRTPLYSAVAAVSRGFFRPLSTRAKDVVKLLLRYGANPDVVVAGEEAPGDWVSPHPEIKKILNDAIARRERRREMRVVNPALRELPSDIRMLIGEEVGVETPLHEIEDF